MKGLLVARVYLFFRFSHEGIDYPCALVHWYSTNEEPDAATGLWVVQPESICQGMRHMSVIHINTIVHISNIAIKLFQLFYFSRLILTLFVSKGPRFFPTYIDCTK